MKPSSIVHNWLYNPHARATSKAKCLKRRILIQLQIMEGVALPWCWTKQCNRANQNIRNTWCGFKIHVPPFPIRRNEGITTQEFTGGHLRALISAIFEELDDILQTSWHFYSSREKHILWQYILSFEVDAYGREKIQLPKPVGRAGPVCKWMAVMLEKLQNKAKSKRAFHYKRQN